MLKMKKEEDNMCVVNDGNDPDGNGSLPLAADLMTPMDGSKYDTFDSYSSLSNIHSIRSL